MTGFMFILNSAARKLLELGYTKRQLRETATHFGTEWRKHTSKPRELTQRGDVGF